MSSTLLAAERRASVEASNAEAWAALGRAREAQSLALAAAEAYGRALSLDASQTEAGWRAAELFDSLGEWEAARTALRRASSGARSGQALLCKARLLLMDRRHAAAVPVLREAIAREPQRAALHDWLGTALAELGRFGEAERCFARAVALDPACAGSFETLVRCRRQDAASAGLEARLHEALGQAGDASVRYRLHLALGKLHDDLGRCAEAMAAWDASTAERDRLCRFDADAFEARAAALAAAGPPPARALRLQGVTPIFIVGLPRSGTTLIELCLACHPAIAAGGEIGFAADRLDRYAERLRASASGCRFVTDKMPLNLLHAGVLHAAFPQAVFVHVRRDLLDTVLSIHATHFNPGLAFPTGGTALVRAVRACERIAAHWTGVLPQTCWVEIVYEDFVRAPRAFLERVLAACGLPWDEACLHPEQFAGPVQTASKWQRGPIVTGAVGRGERYVPWLGALAALR